MRDFEGRTAVITGGASGIGLALARRFAAEGMNVAVADVEEPALDVAVEELRAAGAEVLGVPTDVSELESVRALRDVVDERFGHVHVLCNNAGVGGGGRILDPDLASWHWTLGVNLWGVIHGCTVFGPDMVAHGEPGHIVNTASVAGLHAPPYMGPYNVSKYGVVALTETLAVELAADGAAIGVSVLCPGFVRTAIADSDRNRPERHALEGEATAEAEVMRQVLRDLIAGGIEPAEVADAVLDAVVHRRFWILTHPEFRDTVRARTEAILDGTSHDTSFG